MNFHELMKIIRTIKTEGAGTGKIDVKASGRITLRFNETPDPQLHNYLEQHGFIADDKNKNYGHSYEYDLTSV